MLCDEIDQLRKFSVLNHLAVTKIVKKHDKLSALRLRETIHSFVTGEGSTRTGQLPDRPRTDGIASSSNPWVLAAARPSPGPGGQQFYTSTRLATTFTHAQCVACPHTARPARHRLACPLNASLNAHPIL